MLRTVIGILVLGLAWNLHAQGGHRHPVLYPEKLREDTEVLRSMIHDAHPDPYRYGSRAGLNAAFDRVLDSLAVPVTAGRYLELLMPVFRLIGDAHCYPETGIAAQEHLLHHVPIIPLKVGFLSDGLYVKEELKGFRSLPPGARILAINSIAVDRIVERMERLVIADGANITLRRHLIERDFAVLLNQVAGDTSMFRLRLQVGELEEERTIFAMTGDEIARSRKPAGPALLPWSAEWVPESNSVWVTLRTLEAASMERAGQSASKFLAAMLEEVERNGARTLVLDLRGSAGSDPAMADLVFATIAKAPFRTLQRTAPGTALPEQGGSVAPKPEYYAFVGRGGSGAGPADVPVNDEEMEPKAPLDEAFSGKVYVLCDGGTRDAAALLVMVAKRTGRARIVGEEIGSNALRFTGGGELLVTAPNSGLRVHLPLLLYVPEGEATGALDRGEMPHHLLEEQAWGIAKGRDTAKESVLRMLRELQ